MSAELMSMMLNASKFSQEKEAKTFTVSASVHFGKLDHFKVEYSIGKTRIEIELVSDMPYEDYFMICNTALLREQNKKVNHDKEL
jgi:hypothetical protein